MGRIQKNNSQNSNDPFQILGLTITESATRITRAQLITAQKKYFAHLPSKKKFPGYSDVDAAYAAFRKFYSKDSARVFDVSRESQSLQRQLVTEQFETNRLKNRQQQSSLLVSSVEVAENKRSTEDELREQLLQLKAENERLREDLAAAQKLTDKGKLRTIEAALDSNTQCLQLVEDALRSDLEDSAMGRTDSFSSVDPRRTTASSLGSLNSGDDFAADDDSFDADDDSFDADADALDLSDSFVAVETNNPVASSTLSVSSTSVIISDPIARNSESKKPVPHAESPYLQPLKDLGVALTALRAEISAVDRCLLPSQAKLIHALDQEIALVKFRIKGHDGWNYNDASDAEKESVKKSLLECEASQSPGTGRLKRVLSQVDAAIKQSPHPAISKAIAVVKAILINIATVGLVNATRGGRTWVASFFKPRAVPTHGAIKECSQQVRSSVNRLAS